MTPNLRQYVNKTILVSIPAVFEDGKCRPYKLAGIELIGLWLESAELTSRFLSAEYKTSTSVAWALFIPFSQIACVAIASASTGTPPVGSVSAGQSPAPVKPGASREADEAPSITGGATRKKPKIKNS
jgi:hypothetical protein